MEKTEIILEQIAPQPGVSQDAPFHSSRIPKLIHGKDVLRFAMICVMGVCWGKAEMLHILRPMGIAYLSLFFGEGILFWGALVCVAAGCIVDIPLKAGAALAAACAIQLTLGRFVEREEMLKKALLGAFAMALAGVFFAISKGGLTFYFAVAGIESALVMGLSLLAQRGIVFLWEKRKVSIPTREETLGLVFLFGGAMAGISQMEVPYLQQGVLPCLLAYFLAACAWRDGMGGGSAAGILLGLVLYLCSGVDLLFFTVLGVSGLMAGCLKDLGRVPLVLALMITPVLFLFYADASLVEPLWAGGWALGAAAFFVTPKKYLVWMTGNLWEKEESKDKFIRKKELLEERLLAFSQAFAALAKTFVHQEELQEKKDVSKLVDNIAEKACKGCGMAHYCWNEELYRTYSMTFSALSYCEEKGRVTLSQLPEAFSQMCARGDVFVNTVNQAYDGYRRDRLWLGRLAECRELVSQQMKAVSDILLGLSGQLEVGHVFLEQAGQLLREECGKEGIRLRDVRVVEEKNRFGRQVQISFRGCGCRGVCKSKLLPLVKRTMNRPMVLKDANTCHCQKDGICTLCFTEVPSFGLATATAFSSAEENQPIGDSTAFLETDRGIALMALSDGMGQGKRAAEESRTAIELLEQFTEAGFERDLAVKMINSALLLRKGEETYATLDICAVDLFDGRAEFIKLGAVSSYISRGERILTITAHTLPAGILQQVQIVKNEMLLKDGDMVFLLSDGITEALGGENITAGWLKDKLEKVPLSNPQDAADYILREAKKEIKDVPMDDMTVLAGRFWKKRKSA
ncbi:stage II sporulation protein E [Anaerotignum neopropionicum]|uniref:Stage II sporulation protein E n=1 Tax=Anaerotignum neopropionicum TaxID=36847 RepID=A0A136WC08_9FIRM|nr:stage II sporulation protein E [Anaerotignum neopropionicum]KXL52047.1 stage II sporulation protein E [Anaerotignum neopropionicum]